MKRPGSLVLLQEVVAVISGNNGEISAGNHLIESSFPDFLNSKHDWSEFRLKCLSANLLSPESTNRFR